ncbi:MAG TPA: tRNA 2-thiouridine(34) synthase MnmA, partial [Acidiferrobacteraceae bacterium]|nr:tRNA 2-thiouridine(34) synthase MnmA [Acidiferrobacteraceae bacterium]
MRVIVGVSGGVDSSVAALLLLRAGHDVAALFMKNWEDDDTGSFCSAAADYQAARAACEVLEIPLFATNLAHAYRQRVFSEFLDGYRRGETPNPDVLCNREIKFEAFWTEAQALGAEKMATGHYARLIDGPTGMMLGRSRDLQKDQTYFLSRVRHDQLQRVLFPLASHTKAEVRALAREAGLPNHDRPDSTGICFIGERQFRPFLRRYLAPRPGPIHAVDGRLLGQHEGLMYYTVGQRAGLGIGGPGGPWYVIDKLPAHNLLIAGGADEAALYSRALWAA